MKAALPGIKAVDVQIFVIADMLTLREVFKQNEEPKDATYIIREHRSGMFERSVILPAEVQTDKAKAKF